MSAPAHEPHEANHLIRVEDARARLFALTPPPFDSELLPLEGLETLVGRTLAGPLIAPLTHPGFAASAMDGYALRLEAIAGLPAGAPPKLKLIGESRAGVGFAGTLDGAARHCVRIFTGAPLPAGADCVLIQEEVQRLEADGEIFITKATDGAFAPPLHAGRNIRPAGFDFRQGMPLLKKGQRLTARDIALASVCNLTHLRVYKKPKVAMVATGDELVLPSGTNPDPTRAPFATIASSRHVIKALVAAAGGEILDLGLAADTPESLEAALARAKALSADVFVTLGGASVGDYDLVRPTLLKHGLSLDFWKLAVRPGMPLHFGVMLEGARQMSVLGLPGNPVSSCVCAMLFLYPLIRTLAGGLDAKERQFEPAKLGVSVAANGARETYMRAMIAPRRGKLPYIVPVSGQDSAQQAYLARAECLLMRPQHAPEGKPGERCLILRFGAFGL